MKRLDRSELLAILQNPEQRRQLLAGSVRFIQAVEGRDISLERAMEVVDMAVKRELEGAALYRANAYATKPS